MKKKIYFAILSFCLAFLLCACSGTSSEKKTTQQLEHEGSLEISYIDVDQADATIVCCDDCCMLIDGGNEEDTPTIVSALSARGVQRIDYVICTNPKDEHIGGLITTVKLLDVGKILAPCDNYDSTTFSSFKSAVEDSGKKIDVSKAGDSFRLGSATVDIISPSKTYDNIQDNSLVLKISQGERTFLFSGDISSNVESDILAKGYNLKADFLKVSNHGNKSATSSAWLESVSPSYALISVGENNTGGDPGQETLDRLNNADVTVYRTDKEGSVLVATEADDLKIETSGKHSTYISKAT